MTRPNTKREVSTVTTRLCMEVVAALASSLDKSMWHITETNRYALCKLWMWSQRYSVPLDYILTVLVPYFAKGVEKRTGKHSKSLGVSIPVLTGNVAEEVLQKAIIRDFPDGDNLELFREQERERIIDLVTPPPEFAIKVKSSLQFKTLTQEVEAYARTVRRNIHREEKIANKFKRLPFRNNPWR